MLQAKIKVHMLAFMNGEIREVTVPWNTDRNAMLESVFHQGQNEQNSELMPSVSVGDVIELGNKFYFVAPMGFKETNVPELDEYRKLDVVGRLKFMYLGKENEV